jgi:serine phosphatase RsbU (regulator of sigma subunit)
MSTDARRLDTALGVLVPHGRRSRPRAWRSGAWAVCLAWAIVTGLRTVLGDGLPDLGYLYLAPIALSVVGSPVLSGNVSVLSVLVCLVQATGPSLERPAAGALRIGILYGAGLVAGVLSGQRARRRLADRRQREELEALTGLGTALALRTPLSTPRIDSGMASCARAGGSADFLFTRGRSDGSMLLVLGDVVAGAPGPAAAFATYLRALIGVLSAMIEDPADLLEVLNGDLLGARGDGPHLVTAVAAVLDPRTGGMTWASAGHPLPWLVDRAAPAMGAATSVPLGVVENLALRSTHQDLGTGAAVLFVTDGVLDARAGSAALSGSRAFFGEDGVAQALCESGRRAPQSLAHDVLCAAERFSGAPLGEDATAVVLRLR